MFSLSPSVSVLREERDRIDGASGSDCLDATWLAVGSPTFSVLDPVVDAGDPASSSLTNFDAADACGAASRLSGVVLPSSAVVIIVHAVWSSTKDFMRHFC